MENYALSVFVSGTRCGLLCRSAIEEQTFLFTYDAACASQNAVSLTMPVLPDQVDSVGTIHPVFEMNLPEGQLRHRPELMFSKVLPDFDTLSLLELTGKPRQAGICAWRRPMTWPGLVPEAAPRRYAMSGEIPAAPVTTR